MIRYDISPASVCTMKSYCDKIDSKVVLPPSKEYFDIPSKLINTCNFFCCDVISICSNHVFLAIYTAKGLTVKNR